MTPRVTLKESKLNSKMYHTKNGMRKIKKVSKHIFSLQVANMIRKFFTRSVIKQIQQAKSRGVLTAYDRISYGYHNGVIRYFRCNFR